MTTNGQKLAEGYCQHCGAKGGYFADPSQQYEHEAHCAGQKHAVDAPNFEAIAYELADLMASLLIMLRPTPDWMGMLMNGETGERYTWEEAAARIIDKLPDLSVDRRYLAAKRLPAKARRIRYQELELEKQAKEQAA